MSVLFDSLIIVESLPFLFMVIQITKKQIMTIYTFLCALNGEHIKVGTTLTVLK